MHIRQPLLVLSCIAATTAGQDATAKADTPDQAAEKVLAALTAKDGAAMKALAERADPDPWLVADALCALGLHDAAEAFARAAPRVDTTELANYVAEQRRAPTGADLRRAVAEAASASAAGDASRALELLSQVAATGDVTGVRLLLLRARARPEIAAREESAIDFAAAAEAAERIGWLKRAEESWLEAGGAFRRRTRLAEARQAYENAHRLALHRKHAKGEAWALRELGTVLSLSGERDRALEYLERSLRIWESTGDSVSIGDTLRSLASALRRCREPARAQQHLERALELARAEGHRAGIAETLVDLGALALERGEVADAESRFLEALGIQESLGDRARIAIAVGYLGALYSAQNRYEEALRYMRRTLELMEALGSQMMVAAIHNDIGNVQFRLGQLREALQSFQKSLDIEEENGNPRGAGRTLANMGSVYESMGDRATALDYQLRALRALEERGDRRGAVAALQNIGVIHLNTGDYAKALEYQERCLRAYEEMGDPGGVAACLTNIGGIYMRLGASERAIDYHLRALKVRESLPDRAITATVLQNLGVAYREVDDHEKALECLTRALAIVEELGLASEVALVVGNIGLIYSDLGRPDDALAWAQRALRLREELGDRRLIASTLAHIGNSHLAKKEFDEALACYARAYPLADEAGYLEGITSLLQSRAQAYYWSGRPAESIGAAREGIEKLPLLLRGLGEEEGAVARGQWEWLFEVGIAAAVASGDPGELSFFLESARAGSLLESLGGRDAMRMLAVPAELQEAERDARAAMIAAEARLGRAVDSGERAAISAARAELERTRTSMLEVVSRIQRAGKARADVAYPRARPLAEIQARLRESDALVTYALLDESALALVVTRAGARIVTLGPTADLVRHAGSLDATEIDALREAVVAPLDLPAEAQRVLVSPDGELSFVPFAMLLGHREVVYLPSGTTYALLGEEEGGRGEGVLAVGDPAYSASASPASGALTRGRELHRLPATAEEASVVGDVVLLREHATPQALTAALAARPRWRAVHLACHGVIDPERPLLSALALTGGALTTLDLLKMRIPGDLVILSACETARGRAYKAEGVVGFVRACMFAGAPRAIVSLWKVDDEATKALMVKFYELWNPKDGSKGLPTATALRKAMDFVRDHPDHPEWKDPKYWAAWQLWGLPD